MSLESDLDPEEWVEVESQWWRASYQDVPWSYRRRYSWSPEGVKYAVHPFPPHYQETLCNVKRGTEIVGDEESIEWDWQLNGDLVGVRGIEDAMRQYELDVGIDSFVPSPRCSSPPRGPPMFKGELTEDDVQSAQSWWDDQVRVLFGEAFRRSHLDASFDWEFDQKVWNLDEIINSPSRISASPDVVDLTDSELSAESDPPPTTPTADKKSYAQIVFSDRSPHSYHERTVIAPAPAKPLNAAALSFIPASTPLSPSPESSKSPYTSPTYEFHFPSLTANPSSSRADTRSLPPNLEKDDQGFYIEIPSPPSAGLSNNSTRTATPKRTSASLLPAFLAEGTSNIRSRQISKTRAIVDRLRSSATSTSSEPSRRTKKGEAGTSRTPPTEDKVVIKDNEADMLSDPMFNIDGWITSIENEALAGNSSIGPDGWIEGSSKARRSTKVKTHKRAGSSISSLAPTTPSSISSMSATFSSPSSALTSFNLPTAPAVTPPYSAQQPFYSFATSYAPTLNGSAYPTVGVTSTQQAAAYMQMQYQMQLQAQAQWQIQHLQANARMQPGLNLTQSYSIYQPPTGVTAAAAPAPSTLVSQQLAAVASTNTSASHARAKSVPYSEPRRITVPITGAAGIRHV